VAVADKFMRIVMFRSLRSASTRLPAAAPMLRSHYPRSQAINEMIFTCPRKSKPFGTRGDAYNLLFVTTAHLARRHNDLGSSN